MTKPHNPEQLFTTHASTVSSTRVYAVPLKTGVPLAPASVTTKSLALVLDRSRYPTKDRDDQEPKTFGSTVGFRHNPRCSTRCPLLESHGNEVGSTRDRHLLHAVAPIAAESFLLLWSLGIESIPTSLTLIIPQIAERMQFVLWTARPMKWSTPGIPEHQRQNCRARSIRGRRTRRAMD
jgi:hypothetical protein